MRKPLIILAMLISGCNQGADDEQSIPTKQKNGSGFTPADIVIDDQIRQTGIEVVSGGAGYSNFCLNDELTVFNNSQKPLSLGWGPIDSHFEVLGVLDTASSTSIILSDVGEYVLMDTSTNIPLTQYNVESCQAKTKSKDQISEIESDNDGGYYYDISDDNSSLKLLDLNSIAGDANNPSIVSIDLFQSPRSGIMSTWEINCAQSQMRIIRMMQFEPGGSGPDTQVKNSEIIKTTKSNQSRRMAELACEGEGQLQRDRVVKDSLDNIISSFWGP